ncbi:unnamed protein product [Heligmosomoides polygyrus]|uniref:Histone-lysine N-methyltransferase ASH1L-like n=1 Tax=Heligmosomoides polygyrus TaxID=6339 RepID=A0A183GE37_HELPZ|nr:unnamed protein product [Heligmosomoides polygyrus]
MKQQRSDKTQDSPRHPPPSSTSTGTLPSEDSSLRPPLGTTSTGTLPSEDSSLKKPEPGMTKTSSQRPTEKKSTVSGEPKFIFKVHHPRRKKAKPRPKDTDQQSTSARDRPGSTSTGTLPSEDSSLRPPLGTTSTGTLPSEDSSLKKPAAETTTTSTQRPTEKTSTASDQPKFIFKVHHPRPKKVKPSRQQDPTQPSSFTGRKFIFTPVRSPPKQGKRITRVEKKKRKKKKETFLPAGESESYLEIMNKYAVAGRKIKRKTTDIEQIRERRENIKASREAMKAMDEDKKNSKYSTAQQNISPAPLRPAGNFYSASDCFGLGKNYKRREPRDITHSWHQKMHKDFRPPEKTDSYLDLVLSRRGRRHPKGEGGETAGAPPASDTSTKTTQPFTTPRDEQKRPVDYSTTLPDSSEKAICGACSIDKDCCQHFIDEDCHQGSIDKNGYKYAA